MSIHLEVVDFDKLFHSLRDKPIIINDYETTGVDDKNFIKDLIYTKYENDILSSAPRCNCPSTASPIVGADRVGEFCNKCKTRVTARFDDPMESILWVRAPKGVEQFINFRIWQAIKTGFGKRRFDLLLWLTNTSYNLKSAVKPDVLSKIEAAGIKRGYNNFVRNFFPILNQIGELKEFRRKPNYKTMMNFLENNKDKIFTKYLPLPNRALFVVEPTSVAKTYMDLIGITAIDAITMMTSIDVPGNDLSGPARENRSAKFISNMSIYQDSYLRTNISKKTGSYRTHNIGSRVAPSFRAVITSITEPHDFEQLIIPWNIAMTIFRPHIENIMMKNGINANDILEIFNKYINRYDERLYQLMKTIMYNYTEKGFPTLWNRNPTLGRSSIMMLFIGDIKKDVNDPTVSMSIGLVAFFNAKRSVI